MMPEPTSNLGGATQFERRALDTGEVTLSYLDNALVSDAAPLPTVVFLHGLAGSAEEFVPTALVIGEEYRSVLVDQRGHGHSTRNPDDASREAYVRDAVAVIEKLSKSEGVALVGHSMGAHTAMLVAAARPDLVRMLVLIEGDAQGSPPEAAAGIGAYFASWPVPFSDVAAARSFLGDSVIARAWIADLEQRSDGLYPRFDPEFMRASIAAVHSQPRWAEWESVEAATAALFAPEGMFSDERKTALIEARPATLRVDLGTGSHDAHLDATTELAAVLRDLLSCLNQNPVRWSWE